MVTVAPIIRRRLVPHPTSPQVAVSELSVSISGDPDFMLLRFFLTGDLEALELPPPGPEVRADELWRHTCFEVFIGRAASTEYCEYNMSPSGAWAAYQFSGYRTGMQLLNSIQSPGFKVDLRKGKMEFYGTVDIRWLRRSRVGVRVGVTAVIEDRAGVLSYWALKHPADKPDFHHADGFIIEL